MAFLTGSQKFGKPRVNSDTDLCVLLSDEDFLLMIKLFGEETNSHYYPSASFKIAGLNLICFTDQDRYDAWKLATEECMEKKPLERPVAVSIFKDWLSVIGDQDV